MKAEEIILFLTTKLPVLSPFFSSQIAITSITKTGTTALVTTVADHGLGVGSLVTVANVKTPVVIDTFTEAMTEIEFNTVTRHDLTLDQNNPNDKEQTVRITGDGGFDQTYRLKAVPNRKKFIVFKDSQPNLPAETFSLQQGSIIGYNGLKEVTNVPATNQFEFEMNWDLPEPNELDGAFVATGARISGAVNYDVVRNSYTAQGLDEVWAFVVLDDYIPNKDRNALSDAITEQGESMDYFQRVLANFSVFVIIPNKGDTLTKTNGRLARDMIEDIRVPILQSILGLNPPTDLCAQGQNVIVYAGDNFREYTDAFYTHQFTFQQVLNLNQGDTAIENFNVAFRDIQLILENQFSDVTQYTAGIDLDVEPET